MAVFRWGSTWNSIHDLEREMDRLLQSVNLSFHSLRVNRPYPAINIYERPDEFLLTAEIPGTKSTDLDVSISGNMLTIRGIRQPDQNIPEELYRRRERRFGKWERTISLPDNVEDERMSATFLAGVLQLHIPKTPKQTPRQIPVSDGGSA
ncbi:Hsp20/alpha crystallin family protein [Lacunimicrobium album]